jgi:hypothetical protein
MVLLTKTLSHSGNFAGERPLVFLAFFLLVTLVNWSYLRMPPVWDTAAGVFAPASFLYETHFDLSTLLQSKGYFDAGPNVHSLSLLTILTYLIIALADGRLQIYLPLLHLMQFAFASVVLTSVYAIARQVFGALFAVCISITVLVIPIFLVQTSYLYMEVPGAALVLLAILAWSEKRLRLMTMLSIAACMLKGNGLALVITLIALLLLDLGLHLRKRFAFAVLVAGSAIAVEAAKWSIAPEIHIASNTYLSYLLALIQNLSKVPDLFFLVILSAIFPLLFFWEHRFLSLAAFIDKLYMLTAGKPGDRVWLGITIFPVVYLIFIVMLGLSGETVFAVPRYFVWSLPLMVLTVIRMVPFFPKTLVASSPKKLNPSSLRHIAISALVIVTILSVINREGRFYPSKQNLRSFSIAERSFEYLYFYRVQKAGVEAISQYAEGKPLFVTRGEYYYLSTPLMGYVHKHVPNMHFILEPPYSSGELDLFPLDFLILDSNSNIMHGQNVIDSVLNQAVNSSNYDVGLLSQYQSGPYHCRLFRITKKA